MKTQIRRIVLAAILAGCFLITTGCSKSAPGCSDQQTKDMVLKITRDHLRSQGFAEDMVRKLGLKLDGIRTTAVNEQTGMQSCACDLIATLEDGSTNTYPITYTSELADGGKNFYVSVYGL